MMKNLSNKILLITLILTLFLITISSASAAENTTDLGNLITSASNNSTVELGEGTYKINVTNINIDKKITIVGKGADKTIIDANKTGRIFNILSNGTLTLINLTLINGNASDGGAIYNSGTLTITDCTLSNNTIKEYDNSGGAIYNADSANLIIKNSVFTHNSASDNFNDGAYGYGGAIYNNGYCIINDSYFFNNTAHFHGGAIYNEGGNMNIRNSNFTNNSGFRGGAIYNSGENLTINNCNFINNKANDGGAIYNYGITMIISNSSFNNNVAIGSGGSIYNDGDNMNISKSKFTNNTAERDDGGAIYNTGSHILILDSCFINNTAIYGNGGAIINGVLPPSVFVTYAYRPIGYNLTIVNCCFINNTAYYSGGAISNQGENLNIVNSSFSSNKIEDKDAWTAGGAIFNRGIDAFIVNSTFDNNSAMEGSAIYNDYGENLKIISSNFTNNKGGASISLNGLNTTITSCNIFNNSEGIVINGDDSTINYNRIFNNTYNTGINLDDNGFGNDLDFNWWGDNTPSVNGNLNNYFVMNVTNTTSTVIDGNAIFNYTFRLNNGESAENSLLPYFVTDVFTNVTSGVVTVFDARFDRTVSVITDKGGQYVTYTFITDNEIKNISLFVEPTPTNIDVNNPSGKDGETVDLTAKLTDQSGNPLVNKEIIFHIAGKTLTATTDANGIATVKYTIDKDDFTNGKLAFTATFAGDENYLPSNNTGIVSLIIDPNPVDPVDPVNPVDPINPGNITNTTETSNNSVATATMKKTGLPIIAILIVLLSSLGLIYRKK